MVAVVPNAAKDNPEVKAGVELRTPTEKLSVEVSIAFVVPPSVGKIKVSVLVGPVEVCSTDEVVGPRAPPAAIVGATPVAPIERPEGRPVKVTVTDVPLTTA